MKIGRHRIFKKQWRKLPVSAQVKFGERLTLLITNEFDQILNNHKLSPPFEGYRSINITGDYRLVYKRINKNTYYLRAIGTHHQLYGT